MRFKSRFQPRERLIRTLSWLWFVGGITAAVFVLNSGPGGRPEASRKAAQTPGAALPRPASETTMPPGRGRLEFPSTHRANPGRTARPVRNPEVTDAERATWVEPNWNQWLHLSLQMPLPTDDDSADAEPTVLTIEMLRPESWLREQLQLVAESKPVLLASAAEPAGASRPKSGEDPLTDPDAPGGPPPPVPLSPLRGIYRDLVLTSATLDANDIDLLGLTVDVHLPEMGAVGTAVLTGIEPCPPIPPAKGQVVTATFHHPPATRLLDVYFEGEPDPIGVTENHPFWSVRPPSVPRHRPDGGGRARPDVFRRHHADRQQSPSPQPPAGLQPGSLRRARLLRRGQGLLVHNSYDSRKSGSNADADFPDAGRKPVVYGTPYRQLTSNTYRQLLEKVEHRTISRDEWKRLQWYERLTERRQAGIDAFWARERQLLSQGRHGTRQWSVEARLAILAGGRPAGIFSHHRYSVSLYPQLANDPINILPVTFYEHFFKHHAGGWFHPTHGTPLRPDLPDSF